MGLFDRRAMRMLRTTLPDRRQADDLAHRIVDEGLAACAHVYALQSAYWWKGTREDETEWVVEARTLPSWARRVREAMRRGHPYEVPLVESWELSVDGAYAGWARTTMAERRVAAKTQDTK